MKSKQKIDKILELVIKRIEEEVTALIGADLTLSKLETALISKEDFFGNPLGKQVVAKLDIVGDVEGNGCLLVRLKDAIRLGGTLIMLPLNELEQTIASEDYNDETKDSYGEIANIIAGSYTKVFEETYPKSCRFVRKEQGILIPAKVEIDSDEPIPNQLLYQISSTMKLDDKEMGGIVVLLPASTFGLEEDAEERTQTKQQEEKQQFSKAADEQNKPDSKEPVDKNVQSEPEKTAVAVDIDKHRKRVDTLLNECRGKMEEEVSALLGIAISLEDLDNHPVSKEDFFLEEVAGKQVLAHMKVTGEREDTSYLSVELKDAIRIGGILIMLPPAELETAISEDDFSKDSQDAFGEIANIIAGVYTQYFETEYTENLRLVRTDMEEVMPLSVDTASDTPIPDQNYYVSCLSLNIEGRKYGKMHMLFPLSLLQLDDLASIMVIEKQVETSVVSPAEGEKESAQLAVEDKVSLKGQGTDIVVMSDDAQEAEKIVRFLQQTGYSVKMISFKNVVNDYITHNLKAVFLVMHEVNERAFGVAIKISSSCSVPLIAAGPAWTRTKVIKAVKYGVDDILLIPASDQDIQEKIDNNFARLAA